MFGATSLNFEEGETVLASPGMSTTAKVALGLAALAGVYFLFFRKSVKRSNPSAFERTAAKVRSRAARSGYPLYDPSGKAVAAAIGRSAYGPKGMAKLSAYGRKLKKAGLGKKAREKKMKAYRARLKRAAR